LDLVIFNSGVLRGWGNLTEIGIEGLKENIDTNVYGAYYAAIEFSPLLLKSEFPKKSLVLMSSEFASFGLEEEIFKSHAAAFNTPDHDPTAMYNISKVLSSLSLESGRLLTNYHRLPLTVLAKNLTRF
jgi:NAD(P)-dependent dehydrogenase (short-subunit alcohol dehydrogenase family)